MAQDPNLDVARLEAATNPIASPILGSHLELACQEALPDGVWRCHVCGAEARYADLSACPGCANAQAAAVSRMKELEKWLMKGLDAEIKWRQIRLKTQQELLRAQSGLTAANNIARLGRRQLAAEVARVAVLEKNAEAAQKMVDDLTKRVRWAMDALASVDDKVMVKRW
eukprot:843760_1